METINFKGGNLFMLATIKIDTIEKVKDFVNKVNTLQGDLDLKSDRYTVDAKSIMGIFSLDLSKELTLVYSNSEAVNILKDYIVGE